MAELVDGVLKARVQWHEHIDRLTKSRDYWKAAARMIHDEHCSKPECMKLVESLDPINPPANPPAPVDPTPPSNK